MSGSTSDSQSFRIGVLVSGRGSNLRALHEAATNPAFHGQVVACVSNRAQCGAQSYASDQALPWHHADIKGLGLAEAESVIVDFLNTQKVDYVLLAGYTKLIGENLLSAYAGRMLNIHPGPLPQFGGRGMYGQAVHQAVLDAGIAYSGPCVHLVDANYDEGRLLAHAPVPVREGDTADSLAQRVLKVEHALYWRVAQRFHDTRQLVGF